MDTMHSIILAKTGNIFAFSPNLTDNLEGDFLAFPQVSSHQLARLLLGTPEEIQQILMSLTNL